MITLLTLIAMTITSLNGYPVCIYLAKRTTHAVVIYEMRIDLSTIFDFTGSSESSYSAQYGAEEDL